MATISARPGPARSKEKKFSPGAKERLKFKSNPDLTRPDQFFFRFRPRQRGLSDFKTGPFSCLYIITDFFADEFFPEIIKTTDLVLIAFSYIKEFKVYFKSYD